MHRIEIRFDRVFDVLRTGSTTGNGANKWTEFGFESNNKRVFGACVPEWPQIESGMVVVALLEEPDNWGSIQGWVDCTNDCIVCHESKSALAVALILAAALLIFLMTKEAVSWSHYLFLFVLGAGTFACTWDVASAYRIKLALLTIQRSR